MKIAFASIRPTSLDSFALEEKKPATLTAKSKFMAAMPTLLEPIEPMSVTPAQKMSQCPPSTRGNQGLQLPIQPLAPISPFGHNNNPMA